MKFLIIPIFLLGGCINDPQQNNTHSLAFPLDIGKKWEYSILLTIGDSIIDSAVCTVKITACETNQTGNLVYEFGQGAYYSIDSKDYYEKRENGLYLYASEPGGMHVFWKSAVDPGVTLSNPPILFVPYKFNDNDEWAYDTIVDLENDKIDILKRRYLGIEKVKTVAGIFNCYKFESPGIMGEKKYHYFADGIGLVMKMEVIDSLTTALMNPGAELKVAQYKNSILTYSLISY
jgi:hypothetical protein